MHVIELIEQTPEWRRWRQGGIGASDAPVLCGVSRYGTIASLWAQKRAATSDAPADNLMLARGRVLERQARELYEARVGYAVSACCVEHQEHRWLRASLDGWSAERALPVELKAPHRADHHAALAGRVPARFVPQCLHILLVTDAERMHYVSYRPESSEARAFAVVEVCADPADRARLLALEHDFWRRVRSGEPPTALVRPSLPRLLTRIVSAAF